MKRYLETQELKVLFFTAYFVYSRSKYGSSERGDVRLGRLGACHGVMKLAQTLMAAEPPVRSAALDAGFGHLMLQGDRLSDGTFKTAYLETLRALRSASPLPV